MKILSSFCKHYTYSQAAFLYLIHNRSAKSSFWLFFQQIYLFEPKSLYVDPIDGFSSKGVPQFNE